MERLPLVGDRRLMLGLSITTVEPLNAPCKMGQNHHYYLLFAGANISSYPGYIPRIICVKRRLK